MRIFLLISTACIYAALKRVLCEFGEERALEVAGQMSPGKVIELERQIAVNAAQISTKMIPAMAESILLAILRPLQRHSLDQDEKRLQITQTY